MKDKKIKVIVPNPLYVEQTMGTLNHKVDSPTLTEEHTNRHIKARVLLEWFNAKDEREFNLLINFARKGDAQYFFQADLNVKSCRNPEWECTLKEFEDYAEEEEGLEFHPCIEFETADGGELTVRLTSISEISFAEEIPTITVDKEDF